MKNSSKTFIKILKSLDPDDYGPTGLWTLNYSHFNNPNFFKGHVFTYWYEGVMPDNLKCLQEVQSAMIDFVRGLGQEKFEEGGWTANLKVGPLNVFFQVAGGPGSTPPKK